MPRMRDRSSSPAQAGQSGEGKGRGACLLPTAPGARTTRVPRTRDRSSSPAWAGDRGEGGACLLPTVPGAMNDKSAEDERQILFTRLGGGEGGGEGGGIPTVYCTWSEERQECRGRETDPLHPPGQRRGGRGRGGMSTAYCTWSEERQECRGRGTDPLHPPGRGRVGRERGAAPQTTRSGVRRLPPHTLLGRWHGGTGPDLLPGPTRPERIRVRFQVHEATVYLTTA